MFSWDDYRRYRISPLMPSELRHTDVLYAISSFRAGSPHALEVAQLGESVEGRSISMLTLGRGSQTVLGWSQMHGDEPTHTAALLDVINFLLQEPEHPTASDILSSCTLHFILMLNPDGAERSTRRNAQDIDINRDAIHLQSPEGRILRAAVEALQPEFALNLHNQRPRTAVAKSQQVASFSLLAPPIDAEESETNNVIRAKQLAGHLAKKITPYCPGPVSRYDAEFMPRCFGEWVQQQGAVTLTIEAGGWSTVDMEPLVQLHCYGLVACLESIATGSYLQAAPEDYEALPRTGEHDLFDHLLRNVCVFNGLGQSPFHADLGINFGHAQPRQHDGTIVDIGDLRVSSGIQSTAVPEAISEAASNSEFNLICSPGKIVWCANVSPRQLPDDETCDRLLAQGVTTILGPLDLAVTGQVDAFRQLPHRLSLPVNLGFIVKLTDWSPLLCERMIEAIAHGILGVLSENLPAEAEHYLRCFNVPVVAAGVLPTAADELATLAECASETHQCATQLRLLDRGVICLGAAADLTLLRTFESFDVTATDFDYDLHQVIVGGNVVFNNGQVTEATPGVLLSGS